MAKLLANRWFRWSLLTIALCGLGVGIYRFTPPEPMWATDATINLHHQSVIDLNRAIILLPISERDGAFEHNWVFTTGPIRVLNCQTGVETARFFDASVDLRNVAFSKDHRYFAAEVGRIEKKKFWIESLVVVDLAVGKTLELPQKTYGTDSDLEFSPNGAYLAYSSKGEVPKLRFYESATGKVVIERDGFHLQFIVDEVAVYSNWKGGVDEVYDLRGCKPLATYDHAEQQIMALLKDGRILLRANSALKRKWTIWNLQTEQAEAESNTNGNDSAWVPPNGRHIVISRHVKDDIQMDFYELPSARPLGSTGACAVPICVEISPDGRFFAVASEKASTMHLIEIQTMQSLWKRDGWPKLSEPQFLGDSQTIVLRQTDPGALHVCNSATGKCLLELPLPHKAVYAFVRESKDGRHMVVHQAKPIRPQEPHAMWQLLANWFPSLKDRHAAMGDMVLVIDATTYCNRFRLDGWSVESTSISADGSTLMTMHEVRGTRMLRCWDVRRTGW